MPHLPNEVDQPQRQSRHTSGLDEDFFERTSVMRVWLVSRVGGEDWGGELRADEGVHEELGEECAGLGLEDREVDGLEFLRVSDECIPLIVMYVP